MDLIFSSKMPSDVEDTLFLFSFSEGIVQMLACFQY